MKATSFPPFLAYSSQPTLATRFCAKIDVTRGPYTESTFDVIATVVSSSGKVIKQLDSSSNAQIPLRSAAKPFQALPMLEMIEKGKAALCPQEIAAICSSHWGTPRVTDIIDGLLKRFDLSKADLQCGTHDPLDKHSLHTLIRNQNEPTKLHHQCSGNHTGILIASKLNGDNVLDYLDPSSATQQNVLEQIKTLSYTNAIEMGTDGCGMPAYALGIEHAATMYAQLVSNPRFQPIVNAMTKYPDIVGGDGIDRWLMEVTDGKLVAKVGADGTLCVGNMQRKEGCVLRVQNRAPDVGARVAIKLLRDIGWLNTTEQQRLNVKFPVDLMNTQGKTVGRYVVDTLNWEIS